MLGFRHVGARKREAGAGIEQRHGMQSKCSRIKERGQMEQATRGAREKQQQQDHPVHRHGTVAVPETQ